MNSFVELLQYVLFHGQNRHPVRVLDLLVVMGMFWAAWLVVFMTVRVLLRNYYRDGDKIDVGRRRSVSLLFRYAAYLVAFMAALEYLQVSYLLERPVFKLDKFVLRYSNILSASLVLVAARLLLWFFTQVVLASYFARRRADVGTQHAISQLSGYIVYVIAILLALDALGFNITILWGGAAALLVGVGLGLQQTFTDLVSGLILISDRPVQVGDVVSFDNTIGIVRSVGFRTTKVQTRLNHIVVVPNSHFTSKVITNWNHNDDRALFPIDVPVPYGTDLNLARRLLLQAALEQPHVLRDPAPFVRLNEFSERGVVLQLLFWSDMLMPILDVQSDIRFNVDRLLREHNIAIPVPRRDIRVAGLGTEGYGARLDV